MYSDRSKSLEITPRGPSARLIVLSTIVVKHREIKRKLDHKVYTPKALRK